MNTYWRAVMDNCAAISTMTIDEVRLYLSDMLTIYIGQPTVVQINNMNRKYVFMCGTQSIDFHQKWVWDNRWDVIAHAAMRLDRQVRGYKD